MLSRLAPPNRKPVSSPSPALRTLFAAAILACLALAGCTAAPAATPAATAAPVQPAVTRPAAAISPLASPTAVRPTPPPVLPATRLPAAPAPSATPVTGAIPRFTFRVVQTYPHDPAAFTEGLVYDSGYLYEGTGLNAHSELRKVELATGKVLQSQKVADQYFGEGIALVGERILELTWTTQVGFIYDKATFNPLGQFSYRSEGWGLTYDGQRLIMSDGTPTLHFLDPTTLAEIGRVQVTGDAGPVSEINELEYVRGEVYANIWRTDTIARISPQTGRVTGWIDLTGLLGPQDRIVPVDVLNGIAYDPAQDRLFVTGKWWPKLFQIELVPIR